MSLQQLGDMPGNALLPSMKEDQHENNKVPVICECLFGNVTCSNCCAREHLKQLPQQNLAAMVSQLSFEEQQTLPMSSFSGPKGFSSLACINDTVPLNTPDHLQVCSVWVSMTLISNLQDCTNWKDLVARYHTAYEADCMDFAGLAENSDGVDFCKRLFAHLHQVCCLKHAGCIWSFVRLESIKQLYVLASQWRLLLMIALDCMLKYRLVRSAFRQLHTFQNMLMYVFLAQTVLWGKSLAGVRQEKHMWETRCCYSTQVRAWFCVSVGWAGKDALWYEHDR